VTTAIVLIEAERTALPTLGESLAGIAGVTDVWSVGGEWDFVALVKVARSEGLSTVVSNEVGQLGGVVRTHTMVAFESFGGDGVLPDPA
jgi:DNA-binding Lrp family transcriptional regulator